MNKCLNYNPFKGLAQLQNRGLATGLKGLGAVQTTKCAASMFAGWLLHFADLLVKT
jgi:hypothetical protein